MEMSQLYDEDLLENKFLQQLCDQCPDLFQSAVTNEWMVRSVYIWTMKELWSEGRQVQK